MIEYAQSTKSYASSDFTVDTSGFTSPASGDLYLLFMASGDNDNDVLTKYISESGTTNWTRQSYAELSGVHVEVWTHVRGGSDPGLTFARSTDLLVETILVRVPAALWTGTIGDVEHASADSSVSGTTIDFPATPALVNSNGIGFTFAATTADASAVMVGPTEQYDSNPDPSFLSIWFGEETGLGSGSYNPGILTFSAEGSMTALTVGVSGPVTATAVAVSGSANTSSDATGTGTIAGEVEAEASSASSSSATATAIVAGGKELEGSVSSASGLSAAISKISVNPNPNPNYLSWVISDTVALDSYEFEVSPSTGLERQFSKNISWSTTDDSSRTLMRQVTDDQQEVTITGAILTETQYDDLMSWSQRRSDLTLTDDLGRVWSVASKGLVPRRVKSTSHPWYHTYTWTFLLISQVGDISVTTPSRNALSGGAPIAAGLRGNVTFDGEMSGSAPVAAALSGNATAAGDQAISGSASISSGATGNAAFPGALPSWATGLSLSSGQETALLLDETNTGPAYAGLTEGDLTLVTNTGPSGYDYNIANEAVGGVVENKIFTGNTVNDGSVTTVRNCIFRATRPGGDYYNHTITGGIPTYENCFFDDRTNDGTSVFSKNIFVSGGVTGTVTFIRCHWWGGNDMMFGDVAFFDFTECYAHGSYHTPGGGGSKTDIVQTENGGGVTARRCKFIGSYLGSNAVHQGGSGASDWTDCYLFGGDYHLQNIGATLTRCIGLPSSTSLGSSWPLAGSATSCIEGSWEEVPGIQGQFEGFAYPSGQFLTYADLPAYPGTPGTVLTETD